MTSRSKRYIRLKIHTPLKPEIFGLHQQKVIVKTESLKDIVYRNW